MNVLIHCDIFAEHGMGHASRCRALARALVARGAEVVFVTKTPALHAYVAPFLCFTQGADLVPSAEVVVYDTTEPLATGLLDIYSPFIDGPLVCIDRTDAPAHAALCILPHIHISPATLARLQETFGSRLLTGEPYVMLDQDVTALESLPYAERVNGPIVFCAGGSDPAGVLEKMWAWCGNILPEVDKFFCVGEQVQYMLGGVITPKTHLVLFDRRLLRSASLVVTTMGQTVYECLYWQTPTCIIGHTDRHCEAAAARSASWGLRGGGSVYLGDIRTMDADTFRFYLNNYGRDARTRSGMARHSAGILDGRGVERIANAVMAL